MQTFGTPKKFRAFMFSGNHVWKADEMSHLANIFQICHVRMMLDFDHINLVNDARRGNVEEITVITEIIFERCFER